ncbi:hypothetical protein [Microbispora sp. H10670]|uniref:hypothetical protein n=1 Tax=Microbispora sp. H10670 TaxID=2729108 RepID=UPI001602872D|nr:hypothetical protein [Microbispora sp. H10670]
MPGLDHEMPIALIHNRPETALELLHVATGTPIPPFTAARVESVDSTQPVPVERRADSVVVVRDEAGAATLAVIVEVQRGHDRGKRFSWPVYVTTLRSRYKCDTALLVICPDRAVARWCRQAIGLGPGGVITPLAIEPGDIPLVTDPEAARTCPELAVMSVVAHPEEAEDGPALEALLAGLATLDEDRATVYLNYVFNSLPMVTAKRLEEMVTTIQDFEHLGEKYFSHWLAKGRTEGHAEGEIDAILSVLETRGLEIPDDVRERIRRCQDLDQLRTWVRRAVTVTSAHELFAE